LFRQRRASWSAGAAIAGSSINTGVPCPAHAASNARTAALRRDKARRSYRSSRASSAARSVTTNANFSAPRGRPNAALRMSSGTAMPRISNSPTAASIAICRRRWRGER
jgi:hypothetical protein